MRDFGFWLKNRNIEEGWKEAGTAPRPSPRPRPPSARETRSLREEGEVSAPQPPRTPSRAKPCGPSETQARTHPVPVPPVAPDGILVPRLSPLSAPLGPKAPGGFHSSRLPPACSQEPGPSAHAGARWPQRSRVAPSDSGNTEDARLWQTATISSSPSRLRARGPRAQPLTPGTDRLPRIQAPAHLSVRWL